MVVSALRRYESDTTCSYHHGGKCFYAGMKWDHQLPTMMVSVLKTAGPPPKVMMVSGTEQLPPPPAICNKMSTPENL